MMQFNDWGTIDYKEAWDRQTAIFNQLVAAKGSDTYPEGVENLIQVVLCEHPHVYTTGRNGKVDNLLIDPVRIAALGASYYQTDRGGDVTYHGNGQLVVYPIIDIDMLRLSLKSYIYKLEETVIQTLRSYQIEAGRLDGATGVWLDGNLPTARKICAIGVRASRYITMHGLALNVNTDLSYYRYINPCGFIDKGVTSMQAELKKPIDMMELKERFKKIINCELQEL